jgi:hypothetical protein
LEPFKDLIITAMAATGHACFTATLGLIVALAWDRAERSDWALFPWIAGGALISFGLFYIIRQLTGRPHTHVHLGHEGHSHVHAHSHPENRISFSKSDLAAISSLLALLTFSPCEAFVPVYVSGVRYGWHGFALLTIILTVATIAGMVAFTGLALTGIEQVKLRSFEKYEAGVMGALLCVVGVLIILFEQ